MHDVGSSGDRGCAGEQQQGNSKCGQRQCLWAAVGTDSQCGLRQCMWAAVGAETATVGRDTACRHERATTGHMGSNGGRQSACGQQRGQRQ